MKSPLLNLCLPTLIRRLSISPPPVKVVEQHRVSPPPPSPSPSSTSSRISPAPSSASSSTPPSPSPPPISPPSDGDSVPFLLAEADPSYFSALVSDDAKDVELMVPFVPPIPAADELGQYRLFAAQVAAFSLLVSIHHVAADGSSYTRFLKAWAETSWPYWSGRCTIGELCCTWVGGEEELPPGDGAAPTGDD